MQTQMVTSKSGGELISFKLNGTERIHQGADCVEEQSDFLAGYDLPKCKSPVC